MSGRFKLLGNLKHPICVFFFCSDMIIDGCLRFTYMPFPAPFFASPSPPFICVLFVALTSYPAEPSYLDRAFFVYPLMLALLYICIDLEQARGMLYTTYAFVSW